jgi:hypothetical protein
MVRGAPVLMVDSDPVRVELALGAGDLACPDPGCGGVLGPWGWARGRWQRGRGGALRRLRPRRGRCRACGATHVLLPVVMLLRRVDLAEVIGRALLARQRATIRPHRAIARQGACWAGKRQARLAGLGFADVEEYLRVRRVEFGWSVRRMAAELHVAPARLKAQMDRLGIA